MGRGSEVDDQAPLTRARAPDDLVEGAEIQQDEDPDLLTDDQARG